MVSYFVFIFFLVKIVVGVDSEKLYLEESYTRSEDCSGEIAVKIFFPIGKCMAFKADYWSRFYQTDDERAMKIFSNSTHLRIGRYFEKFSCVTFDSEEFIKLTPNKCFSASYTGDYYKKRRIINRTIADLELHMNIDEMAKWLEYEYYPFGNLSLSSPIREIMRLNMKMQYIPVFNMPTDYVLIKADPHKIVRYYHNDLLSNYFVVKIEYFSEGEMVAWNGELATFKKHYDDVRYNEYVEFIEESLFERYVQDDFFFNDECTGANAIKLVTPLEKCIGFSKYYKNSHLDISVDYMIHNSSFNGCHEDYLSKFLIILKEGHEDDVCSRSYQWLFSTLWSKRTYQSNLPHSYMSISLFQNCNDFDGEYLKRNPGFFTLFTNEDACIEAQPVNLFGIENNAIKGYCDKGKLHVKNYTNPILCNGGYEDINVEFCSNQIFFSCVEFICFDVSEFDSLVCSGHGNCMDYDDCECEEGYVGNECAVGVFTMVCITFGIFFIVLIIILMQLKKVKRKNKEFNQLDKEDVDQLLLEKKRSEFMPKMKINKDLFEIAFETIKLDEEIFSGGGSGSILYASQWQGRKTVFKVFKTKDFSNQNDFDNFEKEISLISSLNHPNIIRFYGCSLKHPRVGILMEYCEMDLIRYLKSENSIPRGLNIKYKILSETASGMSFLHLKNVIHRDLKCQNVMLDNSKTLNVKLIDFGLSKIEKSNDSNKTKRVGTSVYMAPEVTTGNTYDNKCDVFSYGIVMFILITENLHPYGVDLDFSVEMKVASNLNYRPIIPKPFLEDVKTKWLCEMMQECWDAEPKKRPSFNKIKRKFVEKKKLLE